jgi:hypothetical protein
MEIYQTVEKSSSFTPIQECTSPGCRQNRTHHRIHMQTRGSKFIKVCSRLGPLPHCTRGPAQIDVHPQGTR